MSSNLTDQLKGDRGGFSKLLSHVPGFRGYMEKETRRDADKLIRNTLATKLDQQLRRITGLQSDLIDGGGLEFVDDVEGASVKLRTFINRVQTAPRGYGGLFDPVHVREEQLDQLYNFDAQLFGEVDRVSSAIDGVYAAMNSAPAAPAAAVPADSSAPAQPAPPPAPAGPAAVKGSISALQIVCASLNDLYDKREHLLTGTM
ncbi:MAG TPA: hypothetical protein VFK30_05180 [Anaerolineae bacterium]|nr:hypothetical protein [Anaerolineae bacterium]